MFPGFKANNHPQQTMARGALDCVDDRGTPHEVFAPLDAEFGPFTLDVAASVHNTKCARFFDRATNGLLQPWEGERVWCNPPFSDLRPWVEKAWQEAGCAKSIVMLLPSNRCEQGFWQDLVEPFRDRSGSILRTRFLAGRPRFIRPGQTDHAGDRPPFGAVLLIWQHSMPSSPHTLF